jgi:hypothetical protein
MSADIIQLPEPKPEPPERTRARKHQGMSEAKMDALCRRVACLESGGRPRLSLLQGGRT